MSNLDDPDIRGCRVWTGARFNDGYGDIGLTKLSRIIKTRRAHVAHWVLVKGPITPGMYMLHSCDNPPCCALDHLREGTPLDNVRDTISRNRRNPTPVYLYGELNGSSKLTNKEVYEIKELLKSTKLSQQFIGNLYGVGQTRISQIKLGKSI